MNDYDLRPDSAASNVGRPADPVDPLAGLSAAASSPVPAGVTSFQRPKRREIAMLHSHASVRSRNLLLYGALLIAIVVMPVMMPSFSNSGEMTTELQFINFSVMEHAEHAPLMLKVVLLYPLLAGLGLIVLALGVRRMAGAIAILLIPAIYVGLLMAGSVDSAEAHRSAMSSPTGELDAMAQGKAALWALGLVAGWGLLFAGCRARYFRPTSWPAWLSGLCGAILVLGLMLLPAGPTQKTGALLIDAFSGGSVSDAPWLTLGLWCFVLGPVGASICCLMNSPSRRSDGLAGLGFYVLMFSLAALVLGAMFQAMASIPAGANLPPGLGWTLAMMSLKTAGTMLLILFLVPVGFSDVLVNLPLGHAEAAAAE
ncbi:MAG: hypothetical protein BIFFINMI_03748 [Phycisphaerae bacterium]|nr:hypothetical protein [Phycisphaerae bacterium]